MKVLTTADGRDIVSFSLRHNGAFENYRTGDAVAEGIVADRPDAMVKRAITAALAERDKADDAKYGGESESGLGRPYSPDRNWATVADVMRDVRWIGKALARLDVAVGVKVGVKTTGRGSSLVLPEPTAAAYEPKVGDRIAVGPMISPKALMNARGEVVAVNGTRATVRFNAGDLKRVQRATGKGFRPETTVPKSCLELDEA
jgi:hypothetical protein